MAKLRGARRSGGLEVNAAKSDVDRPWKRTFLGFTLTSRRPYGRKESEKSLKAFKTKVRELTSRMRGRTIAIALPARYFAALGLPNLLTVRTGH